MKLKDSDGLFYRFQRLLFGSVYDQFDGRSNQNLHQRTSNLLGSIMNHSMKYFQSVAAPKVNSFDSITLHSLTSTTIRLETKFGRIL